MHVVISDVQHAAFYDLCQQISPKVRKFLSFAFKKYFSPSIVHILKTQLVLYIYIYIYIYIYLFDQVIKASV